jgi:uncharacterized protein (DUF1330 family)
MNWKIRLYDSSVEAEASESAYRVRLEERKPAYVILDVEVNDSGTYETYKKMIPTTVERYGGRFLVRGGIVETLEGEWSPQRLTILEFPSVEQAKAWSGSLEYSPANAILNQSARARMVVVEGAIDVPRS